MPERERRLKQQEIADESAAPSRTEQEARKQRAAVVRLAVGSLVLIGVLFAFVFPTSALLDQRATLKASEHRLSVLREQRVRLARESKRLLSAAEVERLARDRYNMVRPGEHAWAVVPGPDPPAEAETPQP
jgi:cell division protein FtsB